MRIDGFRSIYKSTYLGELVLSFTDGGAVLAPPFDTPTNAGRSIRSPIM